MEHKLEPNENSVQKPKSEGPANASVWGCLFVLAIVGLFVFLGYDWFYGVPDIEMESGLSDAVSIEDCEVKSGFMVSCVVSSKIGVVIPSFIMMGVEFDDDGVKLQQRPFPKDSIAPNQKSRETIGYTENGDTEVIKIYWQ